VQEKREGRAPATQARDEWKTLHSLVLGWVPEIEHATFRYFIHHALYLDVILILNRAAINGYLCRH